MTIANMKGDIPTAGCSMYYITLTVRYDKMVKFYLVSNENGVAKYEYYLEGDKKKHLV